MPGEIRYLGPVFSRAKRTPNELLHFFFFFIFVCLNICRNRKKNVHWGTLFALLSTGPKYMWGKRQAVEVTIFPENFKSLNILSKKKKSLKLPSNVLKDLHEANTSESSRYFARIHSLTFWIISLAHSKFPIPFFGIHFLFFDDFHKFCCIFYDILRTDYWQENNLPFH